MTPLYVRVFDADGAMVAKGDARLDAREDGLKLAGTIHARAAFSGTVRARAFGPRFSVEFDLTVSGASVGDVLDVYTDVVVGDTSNTTLAGAQTAQAQAAALS